MYFPGISEIELIGTFDRGVANAERVVFRVNTPIEMAQFGILIGRLQPSGLQSLPLAVPINDQFFYFGSGVIGADEYVLVYTGPGAPRKTTLQGNGATAFVMHWGRPTTIFADTEVVPVLFRISAIRLGEKVRNVSQLPAIPSNTRTG